MVNSKDCCNKITKDGVSMRIDSCRNCGSILKIKHFCQDCNQPLHFECNNCNAFVDDPIHQHKISSKLLPQYLEVYVN